jgi:hypothetical protein
MFSHYGSGRAGVPFLGDIFLGQCTQKTKNKLIMTALERRNFKKMV